MQSIWTFLLEYSVVQGVLLAILIARRNKHYYLSLLLLAVSYLIFHYLYEHFGWHLQHPAILWTNVPFWFTIGPLFYLHGQSLFKSTRRYNWKDLIHFIPAIGFFAFSIPFYFGSPAEKLETYMAMYGQDYNFDFVQLAYVVQMLLYGYLGIKHSHKKVAKLKLQQSDSDYIHLDLQKKMYWGLISYASAALVMAVLLGLFQNQYKALLPAYLFVFLALAVIVHVATYYIFIYQKPSAAQETVFQHQKKNHGKYASSSLETEELKQLLKRIQDSIGENELYKNPNLRISDLAEKMQIPSHHISQCLNQQLGKNFFDFINEYRVKAVKESLIRPANQNYTLFAIANECGFNSHTSFYRIFKKATGVTPKQYIAKNQRED